MFSPGGHAGDCRRVAAAARRVAPGIMQLYSVCVGCCLLLACCGCIYPTLRPRGVLGAGGAVKLHQDSGVEGLALDTKDRSGPKEVSATEPEGEPDREAEHPGLAVSTDLDPKRTGCSESCSPADCAPPAALIPSLGSRILGVCGSLGRPLRARTEASRHRQPRFHPVPLQPAFLPRAGETPAADRGEIPGDGRVFSTAPMEGSPQTEPLLGVPGPEDIPRPKTESGLRDRVPEPHGQMDTASRPGSWLFNPPVVRRPIR